MPFYRGEDLQPGNLLNGPAIILRADTTILLDAGDSASVDGYHHLTLTIGESHP
jgi:N-methylhydantoinase A/oxoprolinase/acetone carboxylase beta subunit